MTLIGTKLPRRAQCWKCKFTLLEKVREIGNETYVCRVCNVPSVRSLAHARARDQKVPPTLFELDLKWQAEGAPGLAKHTKDKHASLAKDTHTHMNKKRPSNGDEPQKHIHIKENVPMTLGDKITAAMSQKQITIAQASKRFGLHHTTISNHMKRTKKISMVRTETKNFLTFLGIDIREAFNSKPRYGARKSHGAPRWKTNIKKRQAKSLHESLNETFMLVNTTKNEIVKSFENRRASNERRNGERRA